MKEPFKGNNSKNRAEEISIPKGENFSVTLYDCLLYTSDAADE